MLTEEIRFMKDLSELRNAFAETLEADDSQCNFRFVRKYDDKLFYSIQENEGKIRLDSLICAQNLRHALIGFLGSVIAANPDISAQLREREWVEPHDFQQAVEAFIPQNVISTDDMNFVRRLSNIGNHYAEKPEEEKRKISYPYLLKAFRALHRMMKNYYAFIHPEDADELKNLKYREEYQQIASYIVYQTEADPASSYERQYMCFRHEAGIQRYYIIREYMDIDTSAVSRRENEVLTKMWRENTEHPQGIVEFERIDTAETLHPEDRRTYVIYKMNGRPRKLSAELIAKMDEMTRLKTMFQLSESVRNLHKKKIYHRNLQPDSVYICEVNNESALNLTSFEFCKMSDDPCNTTVIQQAKRNYYPNWVFTAPEVRKQLTNKQYRDVIWDKVDIYQMGVLLAFIITGGKISTEKNRQINVTDYIEKLRGQCPDNLLNMIGRMCSADLTERPSANQVFFIVRNCYESRLMEESE